MHMQEDIFYFLNGEMKNCPKNTNFNKLLEILELEPRSIAIELNLEILPKSSWGEVFVDNNDRIEIVQFVGGGF